jgi:hypothetical protein
MRNELCIALALLAASPAFAAEADIRVHERSVAGLSAALDGIDSAASNAVAAMVSTAQVAQRVTDFANAFVAGFLPGLFWTYSYPFTTNGIVFADGTEQVFDVLRVGHVAVEDALHVRGTLVSTGAVSAADANLWRTAAIGSLSADKAEASWGLAAGTVSAGEAVFRGPVTAGVASASSVVPLDGPGALLVSTSDVDFTGDVYVESSATSEFGAEDVDKPVLLQDTLAGSVKYNPVFVDPDGDGAAHVSLLLYPVEMTMRAHGGGGFGRAASRAGYVSAHGLRRAMTALAPGGVAHTARSAAFQYRLGAYALPVGAAHVLATTLIPLPPYPLPPWPEFPDVPDPVPPVDPPPLPPFDPPTIPAFPPEPVYPSIPPKSHMFFYKPWDSKSVSVPAPFSSVTWYDLAGTHPDDDEKGAAFREAKATVAEYLEGVPSAPESMLQATNKVYYLGYLISPPADEVTGVSYDLGSSYRIETKTWARVAYYVKRGDSPTAFSGVTRVSQSFTTKASKQAGTTIFWVALFGWMVEGWRAAAFGSTTTSTEIGGAPTESECGLSDVGMPLEYAGVMTMAAPAGGIFYETGDLLYGFASFGTTYRVVHRSLPYEDTLRFVIESEGTSLFDPGVPEWLARQYIYEEIGTNRVPREIESLYTSGEHTIWRERTAVYYSKRDDPTLRFIRHIDTVAVPAVDLSNPDHPFIVDDKGGAGESGFGNPDVERMLWSDQADAVSSVTATRDATTGAVTYTVRRSKRRPQ